MKEKDFYSIDDVATKLGISIKSVRRMVASGEIKSVKIRNLYRVSKEELDNFLQRNTFVPQNQPTLFQSDELGQVEIRKRGRKPNKDIPNSNNQDDVNWIDISSHWDNPTKSTMTFVDLFCGAGGLSKGMEMSGMEGICGLDWFKEACMTYNRNFDHPFVNGDIKDPEIKKQFYKSVEKQLNGRKLSVVCFGFPCQGFSMSGNRIVYDPRNSLYK